MTWIETRRRRGHTPELAVAQRRLDEMRARRAHAAQQAAEARHSETTTLARLARLTWRMSPLKAAQKMWGSP